MKNFDRLVELILTSGAKIADVAKVDAQNRDTFGSHESSGVQQRSVAPNRQQGLNLDALQHLLEAEDLGSESFEDGAGAHGG